MSALRELQETFAAAVFGDETARQRLLERFIHPACRQAEQGLDAYQTSVQANLAAALVATYPLVGTVVGPDFLAASTRAYARQVPSRSGDLNRYGEDFDRFLACYASAASLPYLPDVARLEWRIQQVHMAPVAPDVDLTGFALLASEEWGDLHFQLDPGHQLLASSWPLARIWEVNQPGYQGDFTVDFEQGETVLIQRRAQGIEVSALAAGEHGFLAALNQGKSLMGAVDCAVEQSPDFDLGAVLQRHLVSGLIRRIA
jgi:hypothetical protein